MDNIFGQVFQNLGNVASNIGGGFSQLGSNANNFVQQNVDPQVQAFQQDFQNWNQQRQQQQQTNNQAAQQTVSALGKDMGNFFSGAGTQANNALQSYIQNKQPDWNNMASAGFWDPNSSQNQAALQADLPPTISNIPLIGGLANGALHFTGQAAQELYNTPYDIANEIKAGTTGTTFEGRPYSYDQVTSGAGKLVQNLMGMNGGGEAPGTPNTPQAALGAIGQAANPVLFAVGGSEGVQGLKGVGEDLLKGNLGNAAKQIPLNFAKNFPIGAAFGTAQGLQQNQNAASVGDQLKATLPQALGMGALTGTVGAASPIIGNALSKYITSPLAQKLISKFGMDGYDLIANKDLVDKALNAPETMTSSEKVQYDALNGTSAGQNKVPNMLQSVFPTKFDKAGNMKPGAATTITDQIPALEDAIDTKAITDAHNQLKSGVADDILNQAKQNGGITINSQGSQPTAGYAYSPSKTSEVQIPTDKIQPQDIGNYWDQHSQELQDPNNHLGIWEDNGIMYLDVSRVGAPNADTLAEANANQQLAVYDLATGETIPTDYGKTISSNDTNQGQVQGADNAGSNGSNPAVQTTPVTPTGEPNPGFTPEVQKGLGSNTPSTPPEAGTPATPQQVTQKMSPLDKLRSSAVELQHMGTTGTQVYQMLDNTLDKSNQVAGQSGRAIQDASKGLNKTEVADVNRALDGQPVDLNPAQQASLAQKQAVLKSYSDWAQKSGIEITRPDGTKVPFVPQDNYFPREIDPKALSENRQPTIDYLVNSGQIPDEMAAGKLVDSLIGGDDMPTAMSKAIPGYVQQVGKMGNLDYSRVLDLPKNVYNYNDSVLGKYVDGASTRLATAEQFGPKNEKIQPLMDQISAEGGNAKVAEDIVNQNLGLGSQDTMLKQGTSAISSVEGAMHTALAGYRHIASINNLITTQKIPDVIGGIIDTAKPGGFDVAADAGSITNQILNSGMLADTGNEAQSGVLGKLRNVTAPFINQVMTVQRAIAANTIKRGVEGNVATLLDDPTNAGANKYLTGLGLNPGNIIKNGGIAQPDMLDAIQEGVKNVLPRMAPLDKPSLSNTPVGGLAFMFKSYPFFQTAFVNKNVLAPLAQGNIVPLIKYVTVTTAIGAALNAGYHGITGSKAASNTPEQLMSNFMYGGGYGLPGEAVAAIGGYLSNGQKETTPGEAMTSFLTTPLASDIENNVTAINQAEGGKMIDLAKQGIKDLPEGTAITNRVFPSTAQVSSNAAQVAVNTPSQMKTTNGNLSETDQQNLTNDQTALRADEKSLDIANNTVKGGFLGTPLGATTQDQVNAKNAKFELDEQKIANDQGQIDLSNALGGDSGVAGDTTMKVLSAIYSGTDTKYQAMDPQFKQQLYQAAGIPKEYVAANAVAKANIPAALDADGGSPDVKTYAALTKVYTNTKLDEPTKQAIYSSLGVKEGDVANEALASLNSADKIDFLEKSFKGMSSDLIFNKLADGRNETLSGKMIADDTTLNGLTHAGVISLTEEKLLASMKFDKNGNNIGSLTAGSGKNSTALNSLIRRGTSGTGAGSSSSAYKIAPVKMPALNLKLPAAQNIAKLVSGLSTSSKTNLYPALSQGANFKVTAPKPVVGDKIFSIYQLGYPSTYNPQAPRTPPRDIYNDGSGSYGPRLNNSQDQSYGGSEFGSNLTSGV